MTRQLLSAKLRRRGLIVMSNTANSLLVPLLNPLVSLLVIRLGSPVLWGEFVGIWIILQLGVHIVSWGNKEYLLRAFSLAPAQIAQAWQTSMGTRAALFAGLCAVIAVWGFSPAQALALMIWGLGLALAQAHEVFIQYRRAFVFSTVVEVSGTALLIAGLLAMQATLNLDSLLWLYALISLGKAIVLLVRFRTSSGWMLRGLQRIKGHFDLAYFSLALPFFLLGFSGMVQSRADLYAASYFLSGADLAHYQVLVTLLTYVQAAANFILVPFTKTIYRLGYETILKLTMRLALFGLAIAAPAMAATYLVLQKLYRFDTSLETLLIGGLYVLPIYCYLPIIYALFKVNSSSAVIAINVLGIVANAALSVALLPVMGLTGALAASAIAQWLMLGAYLVRIRTIGSHDAAALPNLP